MTDDKDFENNEAPSGEQGSEAHASDPASQDEELTIDDILGAAQTDDAAAADVMDVESIHLNDLKRITAEYANYRRRTEEQRQIEKQRTTGDVVKSLLPVLDDIDRAEKHGDLAEGSAFAVIAEKIRGIVSRQGVESYGAVGDVFDPQQHEAIFQQPVPGATESTILDVVEVGYRLGDVELRPAKVVVSVPAE
ncbi:MULTISPECIES: nucleotide exchange factor GrpE [Microbacterium]|jgi:molecular chaperone GrpE|uniref:nucleotide exchange factor GrpE n=1 Tax=Microbacterium TaxID=33882 RepID=UPI001E5A63D0|nr:nucleotide exchange factor GrpE [Microbacterium nymphoidis]MCD2499589.1 nucleotide exchange factor GrpE [Microbacterium nymphoidis]